MNRRRPLRFLMELGSFCKFLHPFISNLRSPDNWPMDLGSFLMEHLSMCTSSNLVSPPKVLGNLFKLPQRLSLRSRSSLRSQIEFGRHCSLSQVISNSVRPIKSPKDSGSSVTVLSFNKSHFRDLRAP
ncbi:hypothetical protein KC19_7G025800 [Ceratodon purpureus]|uniref:Uncharacterized protein n=1 Tax=Ceratodon purpureus TaxID=3225 RepID=A0A8T0H236_CERPU|nr:hypothetical protein KC19_7G025800 [Ceratodon purpureus]